MNTDKKLKKLITTYAAMSHGGTKYFDIKNANYNLALFVTGLQLLRDKLLLETAQPETDLRITTLQSTICLFSNYLTCLQRQQVLEKELISTNPAQSSTELKKIIETKDQYYRQFWETLAHNYEEWFR